MVMREVSMPGVAMRGLLSLATLVLGLAALAGCSGDRGDGGDSTASSASVGAEGGRELAGPTAQPASTPTPATELDGETPASVEATQSDTQALPDPDGPTMAEATQSPLTAALGVTQVDQQALILARSQAVEQAIQMCMAARGFEYTPTPTGFSPSHTRRLELQRRLTLEQFTERFGYGISTLLEEDYREEGVRQFVDSLVGGAPTEQRTEAEQQAFEVALHGSVLTGTAGDEVDESGRQIGRGAEGSCRREAQDSVAGTDVNPWELFFEELGDAYNAVGERVTADPRWIDHDRRWQSCMAERGHSFDGAFEPWDYFQNESRRIADAYQSSPEVLEMFGQAADAGLATMLAAEREEFLNSIGAYRGFASTPSVQADLDELIAEELKVAVDDFDCVDTELVRELQHEYETDFVETHADALAAMSAPGRGS